MGSQSIPTVQDLSSKSTPPSEPGKVEQSRINKELLHDLEPELNSGWTWLLITAEEVKFKKFLGERHPKGELLMVTLLPSL